MEHRALKAEHAGLRHQRPFDLAAHRAHAERLRLHKVALEGFIADTCKTR